MNIIENIHGVLILDKPGGITSQSAVTRVKYATGAKKAGHCGTLDPMATGVLPILLGRATVFSEFFLEKDKRYLATVKLGISTDSYDTTGEVLRVCAVPSFTADEIEAALAPLRGDILQKPPIYSALKRGGKKLCDIARAGGDYEIEPRPVQVFELRCERMSGDTLTLFIHCGKGTYIRSIAHDLGAALGCGAAMSGLRRLSAGPFSEEEAVPLEELLAMESGDFLARHIRPVDECLAQFPKIECAGYFLRHVKNGLTVAQSKLSVSLAVGARARLYEQGSFLGIAEAVTEGDELCLKLYRHA